VTRSGRVQRYNEREQRDGLPATPDAADRWIAKKEAELVHGQTTAPQVSPSGESETEKDRGKGKHQGAKHGTLKRPRGPLAPPARRCPHGSVRPEAVAPGSGLASATRCNDCGRLTHVRFLQTGEAA
jgi:hypothetical protein